MKIIIAILAFIGAVQGSWLQPWLEPGLRARYAVTLTPGSSSFYNIPRTVSSAKAEGWIETERYDGAPIKSLVMYCSQGCIMCGMYDDIEDVAGIQVSIPHEEISGDIYNWTTLGYTNWTTTVNGTYKSFWSTCLYFVSDGNNFIKVTAPLDKMVVENRYQTLAKSQEDRLAARAVLNVTLQEDFLLATGINNELVSINRNASDVTSESSIFTKQGCMAGMGHHYYWNMTNTTLCSETTLFPWFPLVYSEEIIGIGLSFAGQVANKSGQRYWFEDPDKTFIETNVPYAPQCLYDLADSPGVVTIHIYFVDKPWLITCLIE